jgi:surfeit locus 1 family protein
VRRIVLFGFTLLVAAGCIALGVWQLRRLATRRAANREMLAAQALPPLLMEEAGAPAFPLQVYRRARLRGALDESREFLLRDRVVQGIPAVLVITPLRLAGSDSAVLINRGYVPAADAIDPGAATWSEAARREFHGILLAIPDGGEGMPLQHAGRETWQRLDLHGMQARLPYPIAPVYLLAEPDSADPAHTVRGTVYPFRAEAPPLSEGPHLMYAVQWFGIALAVAAFGVVFVWRGGPHRSGNGQRSTVNGERP